MQSVPVHVNAVVCPTSQTHRTSIDEYLDCIHMFAKASVTLIAHVLLYTDSSNSPAYLPKSRIAVTVNVQVQLE